MIRFYFWLAQHCFRWRYLLWLALVAFSGCFTWLLLGASQDTGQRWLLICTLLLLCNLLLLLMTMLFQTPLGLLPPNGFVKRLRYYLNVFMHYLLALTVTLVLFALLILGGRVALGIIRTVFFN